MAREPAVTPPPAADILDGLAGAVLVASGDELALAYMNTAAEDLLRVSRRRALGQPLGSAAGFEAGWLAHVAARVRAGEALTARAVRLAPAGTDVDQQVDASVTPAPTATGPPLAVIELTAVDRHLRIARDEALRVQEQSSRRLLRGLAHEIRNPLAGLRGAAQLLAGEISSPALRDYTDVIVREADRLRGLVDRMLGPVRAPRLERLNVHRVTEHVVQLLRAEAGAGVRLDTEYDPSLPEIEADADQVVQALLNLGRNALEAVGDSGAVVVRTRALRRFTIGQRQHRLVACIEVADDGPGVPPELAESLFQPMVSGRAEGSGLGLTIAQTLVGRHGGLIECDSAPGATVFRVLLPLEATT